jgi:ABC-type nitrate/sulfonate/bicarbonate transport system permease component
VLLGLALAGAVAPATRSASVEGEGAFNELANPAQQETTPTTTTASTASTESTPTSNSRTVIVLALGAAVALLIGIAFVIVRDARKVAPAGEGQLAEPGSARKSAARLRRRRARAKAARRQRRRNR